MKRVMCLLMLLLFPVVGFADHHDSEESKRQKDSESTCDIKDKDENSISNPSVAQVISSEEDANYRRCLSDKFASILSDPASEVSALVCENKEIGKIKNLGCFSGLNKLDLSANDLEEIDLSANTALTELDLSANDLEEIDLSANTALTELDLSANDLEEIDLSANTALTELDLSDNGLKGIDLSANTALTELDLSDNSLKRIDLSGNEELKYLHLEDNELEDIDFSENKELEYINLKNNNLKSFPKMHCLWLENWNYPEMHLDDDIWAQHSDLTVQEQKKRCGSNQYF